MDEVPPQQMTTQRHRPRCQTLRGWPAALPPVPQRPKRQVPNILQVLLTRPNMLMQHQHQIFRLVMILSADRGSTRGMHLAQQVLDAGQLHPRRQIPGRRV